MLAQVGGNLLGEIIKMGGNPFEILALLKFQQRNMLTIGLEKAGPNSPFFSVLKKVMENVDKEDKKNG